MSGSPLVTVLTAVHNGAKYLPETIACIQAQTFSDWEYLIVDDASNDGTVQLIEEAATLDPRIRLLSRKASAGPYTAANDGLQDARGKFIVRIDADDLSPADRIQKQIDFLSAHPDFRACVSYWQVINDRGLVPGSTASIPVSVKVFRWYLLLRSPALHSAVCYERAAMAEIGGYRNLPISQDYRLWCELTRRGWLGVIPEVLSYVRAHSGRISFAKAKLQRDLAVDVMAEHLFALTGQIWPREDLEALNCVGYSETMPVGKGLEMLDRWDQLWKAASDLTKEDRKELARLSAFRCWKHLRANARRQPVSTMCALLKVGLTKPHHMIPAIASVR